MPNITYDFYNTLISGCALAVSAVSLALHYVNHTTTKYNVKLRFDYSRCFYFEGIENANGSTESLLIKVLISNDSAQPITISDMQIDFGNGIHTSAAPSPDISYPTDLPPENHTAFKTNDGSLGIKVHHGDGCTLLDLHSDLICFPKKLQPYDCVEGYVLFPTAGISVPKTKLRIVTSRKTKVITRAFRSKTVNEHSFT